jgi:hypothetical protein
MAPRRFVLGVYLVIGSVWVAARAFAFAHTSPWICPDSADYLAKAAEPLWSWDFFFGGKAEASGRFFVVPLFYKVVRTVTIGAKYADLSPDGVHCTLSYAPLPTNLTYAQFVFSLLAWLAFALALSAQCRRRWVSVLAFTAALTLGLSAGVTQWDSIILSESVSTSLFVFLMAMWISLSDGITTNKTVAILVIAIVWSMSREANSLLVAPLGVAVLFYGVWYLRSRTLEQRLSGVLGCGLLAIVVTTFAISAHGDRWVLPLLNVIGRRVLPTPEKLAFFQAHGMPVNPRLLEMSGEYGSGKNFAFYKAPELAAFRTWLYTQGRRVYARDLLTHPIRSLAEPVADIGEFVCPTIYVYWSPGFRPIYTVSRYRWLCSAPPALVTVTGSLLIGVGLIAGACWSRRGLDRSRGLSALTAGVMFVGWLPFTWLVWHVIGGMEIARHEWSGVLMFRVALVLLVACVGDTIGDVRARESAFISRSSEPLPA